MAQEYDSLYQNRWSKAEDEQTVALLKSILRDESCDVLDLACGTGLGLKMCLALSNVRYVGLDISPQMLARFKEQYPYVSAHLGVMSDLSEFSAESFDVVISLYTSFSYTDLPVTTLKEIYRVLRPGGRILISFLNRWSLRRLINLNLRRIEEYKTRNSRILLFTPTLTFSRGEMLKCLHEVGFSNLLGVGQGIFGGWLEKEFLWKADISFAHLFPNLCNIINIRGVKSFVK